MPDKLSEKTNKRKKIPFSFILHIHPKKINVSALRFNLTFGLGGMAALLVVFQAFTGLLLKFHYHPSPELAYDSIQYIQDGVLFGQLIRNLHHWSAIFLLCITFLHMLRVVFTGAYKKPRHATWILGVFLLILIVLENFTGYLLPWDQLSYWAITISTSLLRYFPLVGERLSHAILGGEEVGSQTLINFFNLHTGIIPVLILILLVYHFWRIRKAGGVVVPEDQKHAPRVDVYPHLVSREFVVALVLMAVLFVLSVFFDAPLKEHANPSVSPNPSKAPWYFMGLQELLIHFHPVFAVFVFPFILLIFSIWLPFSKMEKTDQGVWFLSSKGIYSAKISAIIAFFATVFFILMSEILPDPEMLLPNIPSLLTKGVVPALLVALSGWGYLFFLKGKIHINRPEYIQSVIIMLVVAYSVMSITGIFFRGEGMEFVWPWQVAKTS